MLTIWQYLMLQQNFKNKFCLNNKKDDQKVSVMSLYRLNLVCQWCKMYLEHWGNHTLVSPDWMYPFGKTHLSAAWRSPKLLVALPRPTGTVDISMNFLRGQRCKNRIGRGKECKRDVRASSTLLLRYKIFYVETCVIMMQNYSLFPDDLPWLLVVIAPAFLSIVPHWRRQLDSWNQSAMGLGKQRTG